MLKLLSICFLLITFQNRVSSLSHLGHLDLKSYSDPRFLNSDYQLKGLGYFHPNSGAFESHGEFSEEKKGIKADDFFDKHGASGENSQHGHFGGFKEQGDVKDVKGETGHFFDNDGEKNERQDGKDYYGKKQFGSEEKTVDEKAIKQGHRKGHKIKGFSNSHHNDESGNTEQFYDEEHDEADDEAFGGKSAGFGADTMSTYKGGHEDGGFKTEEIKKGVVFNKGEEVKKVHEDAGHFGDSKFDEKEDEFGGHKGVDEGGLSGFVESSKFVNDDPAFYF